MPDPIGTSGTPPGLGEDAFFILRDARALFQRRLVEIARRSGIHAPQAIDAFAREIETAYDELAASTKRDGFEQTSGLTASRISLVGHDDLELEIRIGDLINRLKGNERIDRWRVQLRYMTLLDRPRMSAENNPGRPRTGQPRPVGDLPRKRCHAGPESGTVLNAWRMSCKLVCPTSTWSSTRFLKNMGSRRHRFARSSAAPAACPKPRRSKTTPAPKNPLSALQETLRPATCRRCHAEPRLDRRRIGRIKRHAGSRQRRPERVSTDDAESPHGTARHPRKETWRRPNGRTVHSRPLALTSHYAPSAPRISIYRSERPAAIALDTLSMIFDAIFATPDLPEVVKTIIGPAADSTAQDCHP